jgi:nucleotide-binding universal stress UspA family protein
MSFKKLGLAITFSPTGKALLKETARLQKLFDSQLVLIHVGDKNTRTEEQLAKTIYDAGLDKKQVEIIWEKGDPANAIINSGTNAGVDLLIAGALEKENIIKYYLGSVARKIMREFPSSLLILKSPSEQPSNFRKFYVSVDYSPQSEKTIRSAFQFALKEKAEKFTLIRDFHAPGLAVMVQDGGSFDKVETLRKQWQGEEEEKLKLFVKELNLQGLEIKTVCLYGKEGWEASNFARANNADIFAVAGPVKKTRFLDRLFPHEVEYSIEKLPSNLLIIK